MNLETLESRREKLTLNWAKKATVHNSTKGLFPLNKATHDMKTRNKEKYQVTKANTERFKKSSIVYIQTFGNCGKW